MATRTRIKWNRPAFAQIRRLPGVESEIESRVSAVLDRMGDGYEGGTEPGRSRVRGYVVTSSMEAIIAQANDASLLRALASGGTLT